MPRLNVIILDRPNDDNTLFNYVMWADVPAARQLRYASSTKKSAWTGASSSDNAALQSGSVAESVESQRVPAGSTLTEIEGFLMTRWTTYQSDVNNYNPWNRYGSFWDGTSSGSSSWTILNNG